MVGNFFHIFRAVWVSKGVAWLRMRFSFFLLFFASCRPRHSFFTHYFVVLTLSFFLSFFHSTWGLSLWGEGERLVAENPFFLFVEWKPNFLGPPTSSKGNQVNIPEPDLGKGEKKTLPLGPVFARRGFKKRGREKNAFFVFEVNFWGKRGGN